MILYDLGGGCDAWKTTTKTKKIVVDVVVVFGNWVVVVWMIHHTNCGGSDVEYRPSHHSPQQLVAHVILDGSVHDSDGIVGSMMMMMMMILEEVESSLLLWWFDHPHHYYDPLVSQHPPPPLDSLACDDYYYS